MDIDSNLWTTIGTKKKITRSPSPPAATCKRPTTEITRTRVAITDEDIQNTTPAATLHHEANLENVVHSSDCTNTSDRIDFIDTDAYHHNKLSDQTTKSETTSIGKQSALQLFLNIPTNDGTFRTTFCWKPKGDFKNYTEQSTVWLTEAHALMTELFKDSDCSFYRWKSVDLTMSRVMSEISPGELREFLSPNVTFLPSASQIILGARICFAAKFPGHWITNERTRKTFNDQEWKNRHGRIYLVQSSSNYPTNTLFAKSSYETSARNTLF